MYFFSFQAPGIVFGLVSIIFFRSIDVFLARLLSRKFYIHRTPYSKFILTTIFVLFQILHKYLNGDYSNSYDSNNSFIQQHIYSPALRFFGLNKKNNNSTTPTPTQEHELSVLESGQPSTVDDPVSSSTPTVS